MNEFQYFAIGGGVGLLTAVGLLVYYMIHRKLGGVASDITDIKNWIQAHFPNETIVTKPTIAPAPAQAEATSAPHA